MQLHALRMRERLTKRDLADLHVTRIDPAEYAPGSERYERLMAGIEEARRWEWPSIMEFNV